MEKRHCTNWLESYLELTENTEPPTSYHLWTGIMTIAACLQRKCWFNWGHMDLYPNLYAALIGPPGGRKGTAMKIGKSMLQEVGVQLASDCITPQALALQLEEVSAITDLPLPGALTATDTQPLTHCSLTVFSEEMAVFLGDRNPVMITYLTDLFDCPAAWEYKTKNRGENKLSNVWFNFFGAATPTLLQAHLTAEAVGGGLVSRIIFVVERGKKKKVPLPILTQEELNLRSLLVDDLVSILSMRGPFIPTQETVEAYYHWYLNEADAQAVDDVKFEGYNERRAIHLLKLSMICSAAETSDRVIEVQHFTRAVNILLETEKRMRWAFYGVGRGDHASILSDMILFLAVRQKVLARDMRKRFELDVLPEDFDRYIGALQSTGKLVTQSIDGHLYYLATEELE